VLLCELVKHYHSARVVPYSGRRALCIELDYSYFARRLSKITVDESDSLEHTFTALLLDGNLSLVPCSNREKSYS